MVERRPAVKAFVGLVMFPAIAGNNSTYRSDIFACLNSLLQHGLLPAMAGNYPSFVFPADAGTFPSFNWSKPENCPRFFVRRRKS